LALLPRKFFQTDPLVCASELIGTTLKWGRCAGVIVETEGYLEEEDEASHTFSRPSARSFVARNKAGACYIYFNYGVHWMLNVLVKAGPRNGLILIRALEPKRGINLMKARRGVEDLRRLCSGPGKLTEALDINARHHEIDLCRDPRHCFIARETDIKVVADQRIGISRSKDFPWRFTLRDSEFVSRPARIVRRAK
jgi:DNA-3-methyladenine glycosylase